MASKAAASGNAVITHHPFLDGNKRVGHADLEAFLLLNGHEIQCPVEESEHPILAVAAGEVSREELATWVSDHSMAVQGAGYGRNRSRR